ncbi:MAG TPA: type I methionyl aminopeptidase [Candidatus Gallimonas gallistercoris]|uniref:Methionine aminopeptidase n=1 Tax=Candidatus Gallimonas gallistercoris TaxID=2838602 RepID=A0A9D2KFC3_9FIRM|nr:type I methionyl aminopeptidase [Candidatus Gallimonas gallistercoris]
MVHVKSEEEIDLMRAPCAIVRDCLSFVGERIKPGMTTGEVDQLVYDFIKASGAEPSCLGYGGFPASACVSVNEVVVHGIPDDRVLEEGDIVSVDLCAYKNGFHGDGARTFAVGEISPEKKKLIRVTEECFFKALEGLRAGTPLFDIGYRVQTHAESNGFSVIRSYTGHGIGREMHEDPSVYNFGRRGTGMRLKAGTVICIEPMIAMGDWRVNVLDDGWTAVMADKKPAAHYENTVVIREDGTEILTL